MHWSAGIEAAVDDAVARATAGIPTVLDIEGQAGFGKTQLARTVAQRVPAGAVVRATAYEDTQSDPLGLLDQLGVETAGLPSNALSASRALGAHLDALAGDGPLVVVLDDLHWADPESLDAVGVLMERMAGDRVLLVAAHRPDGARHARWRSRLADIPSVVGVVVDGLDDDATLELIREAAPDASPGLARALRAHTGGSPLFLRSLLHEHDATELAVLAERNELPASSDLIATMGERLARLDPDAVAALSAIAVLGGDGAEPFVLSAVADVPDIGPALDLLTRERLVVTDRTAATPRARIFHGVVRAAVYDNIPPATRERMHAAAAARVPSPGDRLRHRVAAARGSDDGLAADLRMFADALHERLRYREAARFRRYAARMAAGPEDAVTDTFAADFESILALDLEDVSVRQDDVSLEPRARFLVGATLAAEKRFVASSDVLETLTEEELAAVDPLTAYRARVLRAWSTVAAGRSPQRALHDLDTAKEGPVTDPAVQGYFGLAHGQAAQRAAPVDERMSIPSLLSVDRAQLASTPHGTVNLAWRGAVMSLTGMPEQAIGDLGLITSRFGDGLMDFGDGVFHALQGFAHFVNGQWPRAAMMIDLSRAGRLRNAAPLTAAIEPLAGVVAGDPERVGAALAEARRIRVAGPQPAAVHAGDIVDVLALAFAGTDAQRAAWLEGRIRDLGDPADWAEEQVPHLWYVAQAIGAGWAGRPGDVPGWAHLLRTVDPPPWSGVVADWLEARVDESPAGTARLLEVAARGIPSLPAIDALLRFDVAARTAADSSGPESRRSADMALREMGADLLADRLPSGAGHDAGTAREPASAPSLFADLSEREREVAALILEGLSYTQVAKELFITRSTVSFHLSRIYAKTGTASRHELVEAARRGGD